jgi:hypothetical protein
MLYGRTCVRRRSHPTFAHVGDAAASDGRILGTILYFRTPRSPQRRDFDLMSRMAQLAGIAVERRPRKPHESK